MKKVLVIILGVLMCIGGIYCMITPIATYASVSVIFSIVLVENALGYFFIWNEGRKVGKANAWLLVTAILSLVGGFFIALNPVAQIITDSAFLGVVAGFMVAMGITRIIDAFNIKKVTKGNTWIWVLLMGILVAVGGVISFLNPVALAISLGLNMAINIFLTGISLIVAAFAVDAKKQEIEERITEVKKVIKDLKEENKNI